MQVKKILSVAALCLAFVLAVLGVQRLLEPKYMQDTYDGALTKEYYQEPKNHQVLFVGDCEVYENFSPAQLYREHGVVSYIRGGAQQLIWHSYYLLEDALKYETPDVVVFNVLAMKYGEPQSEAYNRLNLDGMRLSPSKIQAVQASMCEGEDALSYVFPLLRYHERWSELNGADLRFYFATDKVAHNGYMMRADTKPTTVIPKGSVLADYALPAVCYEYLDKMTALCKEKGIELLLVKAPTIYPHWYEQWDAQIEQYAQDNGLTYINFLNHMDDMGLDLQTDTYDAGLHLNVFGAEKLSDFFGEYLRENLGLADMRNDPAANELWQKKLADYDTMKSQQLLEIQQTGKIQTYTFRRTK